MLRNKVEIEIIKTDSGRIRIVCSGCNSATPETAFGLIANLEVELLSSLGILNKMDFKVGDRVIVGEKDKGIITKIIENDMFVRVRMDNDLRQLHVSRKHLEYDK